MMSINLGLTSNENYNCVVGFSGKIINQEDLKKKKKYCNKNAFIAWRPRPCCFSYFFIGS